jgi:hypothetical protein
MLWIFLIYVDRDLQAALAVGTKGHHNNGKWGSFSCDSMADTIREILESK